MPRALRFLAVAGGGESWSLPEYHRNGFVILRPFTFPVGLHGANSATFIVARGVRVPAGNPGHSTVYDMNTGGCTGVMCGRFALE